MSTSKMLIDASHPEETRVVVLKGNRVEEFDFESANKRQLRGNIYLAKVTRVEPSLQAAFIEYGGNRHGFLAFSEIHPDYYQIPHADRQALLEEEARAHREDDDEPRSDEVRGSERSARGSRGERTDRGERTERAESTGRGERNERGERGQRRSRRHRRDGNVAAFDRRSRSEETVSEAATAIDAAIGFDGEGQVPSVAENRDLDEVALPLSPEDASNAEAISGEIIVPVEAPAFEPPVEAEPPVMHVVETAEPMTSTDAAHEGPSNVEAPPSAAAVDQAPEFPFASAGDDGSASDTEMPNLEAQSEEAIDLGQGAPEGDHGESDVGTVPAARPVEQIGGDALEDAAPRAARPRRHHYKIQEVIKRRQILLIQVVKEERGNKGAALTTYLSLAGRYSVLMPNTARGGGISRKITDGDDRKRLKAIASELDVPEGMGVILRTAGASRSNQEVKRDFEYLLRMWESVRELTLKSTAPTLVYEEGSLIKRSIRDLYSKDVEDIVVAGDDGFAEARDFMRMLMPGNVKSVQLYRDPQPIFAKSGVEAQLDAMFSNHVTLKSGGYLVINQTEALVAIDVNSGRSTREHNIEDTALRTNLEAADEVARQLRLRDLAGLIVVDFIDMEEGRNNRAVERRIKDALKNDRARIQIGHISHFGLMEMSRQRIRTGVLEGSTIVCPHCAGSGSVRSTASIALHVLRLVEDALIRDASHDIVVRSRTEVALYMLNQKRVKLVELERRFGVTITVMADAALTGMVYHAIERGELATPALAPMPRPDLVRVDSIAPIFEPEGDEDAADPADEDGAVDSEEDKASADDSEGGRRRKRRRRRRGRDRDAVGGVQGDGPQPPDDGMATMAEIGGDMPVETPLPSPSFYDPAPDTTILPFGAETVDEPAVVPEPATAPDEAAPAAVVEEAVEPAPRRRRSRRVAVAEKDEAAAVAEAPPADEDAGPVRRRRRPARSRTAEPAVEETAEIVAPSSVEEPMARPSADRDVGADTVEHHGPATAPEPADVPETLSPSSAETPAAVGDDVRPSTNEAAGEAVLDPDRPKRSGWWQRAKASFGS